MCIIVAKPEGIDFPNTETLENCFNANPDGAGYMFARDKRVYIRKGFMDFESFLNALESENISKNESCVMHFRIGTQGGNTPENCHPFPIPATEETISELSIEAPIGMAHNGIIGLCSQRDADISDTMIYALDIVSPLFYILPSFMQNDNALKILEETCESRLCFIDSLGDITTVGDFIEDHGILYSNTSYLSTRTNFSTFKTSWYYDDMYKVDLYEACEYCRLYDECEYEGPMCINEEEAIGRISYIDNLALTENKEDYSI